MKIYLVGGTVRDKLLGIPVKDRGLGCYRLHTRGNATTGV